MFVDVDSLDDGARLECDVCIVGAGAAGISLARALEVAKLDVCLLEAGGVPPDPEPPDRFRGELDSDLELGADYLTVTRLRRFGGTTNHWVGWCRPLDAIDFEARDWIPHSGWPFSREELRPWYDRASALLEVEPFPATEDAAEPLAPGSGFRSAVFHMSPPVRMGAAHGAALGASTRVRVLLHADATGLRSDRDGRRVTGVSVRLRGGAALEVRARHVVLAAGAIENARLLLVSRDANEAGLGNAHDRVGRFFMDHPHRTLGEVAVSASEDWLAPFRLHRPAGFGCDAIRVFKLDESVQRARRLPNADLLFRDPLAPPASELAAAAAGIAGFDRDDAGPAALTRLRARSEPVPNPESRVRLAETRDALGVPRVRLEWRLTPRDGELLDALAQGFAAQLGRAGRGRVRLAERGAGPFAGIGFGSHHMGTTRMHEDPKQGVVDRDARVHGMANLWIAGSSVFPTAGSSNPTLTLVALALRLAARLAREPRE